MKIVVEKVPEGVRVELQHDAAKKPTVLVLGPNDVEMLTTVIRTAMKSEKFRFEYKT